MTKTPYFGFCPYCEKETNQVHVVGEIEDIIMGGVKIAIETDYFHCDECGEMYDNPRLDYDPLALAYAEFERITGKKWKGIYK